MELVFKDNSEKSVEHIEKNKLETPEFSKKEITSIQHLEDADQKLTFNDQRCFDFKNIQKETGHITHVFGKICPEISLNEVPIFNNLAIVSEVDGDHDLLYNKNFLWHISQEYGNDAVSGVMAHEVGHQVTDEVFKAKNIELGDWHNELCADFLAGVYLNKAGLSTEGMEQFFSKEAWHESASHPGGAIRIEALQSGYGWAKNNIFSDFQIKGSNSLKQVLEENVIDKF